MDNGIFTPSMPIPLQWYIDDTLTLKEVEELEKHPFYLGTTFAVPCKGDYIVCEQTFKKFALIHGQTGINAVSNICRHRQSLLLKGYGTKKTITCPLHYWTYDLEGVGLNAPGFDKDYPCPSLGQLPISQWGSFLFKQHPQLQAILSRSKSLQQLLDHSYFYGGTQVLNCAYNWKIFMETYLDLYHINSIHPGLRKFVSCKNPSWEIDPFFVAQTVEVILDPLKNPSPYYKKYSQHLMDFANPQPDYKVTWFAIYPNTMVEIYPYALVMSSVLPLKAAQSLNVIEFYFDARLENHKNNHDFQESFKQAYLETAAEDDKACEQLQQGRQLLALQHQEDYGPFHQSLETGIPSFYHFWNKQFIGSL